jgi:hypothetical protein
VRVTKEAMMIGLGISLENGLRLVDEFTLMSPKDFEEGVTTFSEIKKPLNMRVSKLARREE